MAEPNRLRDQATPNVGRAGTPVAPPATTPSVPGVLVAAAAPWTRGRIVIAGAVGELAVLLLVAIAGLTQVFALVAGAWVAGHFGLGLWVASRGDGRLRIWATLGAVTLASVVAGVVLALAIWAGLGHVEQEASGPLVVLGTMILGVAVSVLVLGFPIVVLGTLVGSIPARRRRRSHVAAVAIGRAALIQPIEPLTQESDAKAPLDDAELAKVTAGGAATRIVRTYPWAGGEAMLAADRARLAAIGYLVTKVERRAPPGLAKRILGVLVGIVLVAIALAGDWFVAGHGSIDLGLSGRIRATFDLVASDHHAVPDNASL